MKYISGSMPKSKDTKRVEVHLMPDVVKKLQDLADKGNRSLKNYIETIIVNHVNDKKRRPL